MKEEEGKGEEEEEGEEKEEGGGRGRGEVSLSVYVHVPRKGHVNSEKAAICKRGRQFSPETKSACTLILNF